MYDLKGDESIDEQHHELEHMEVHKRHGLLHQGHDLDGRRVKLLGDLLQRLVVLGLVLGAVLRLAECAQLVHRPLHWQLPHASRRRAIHHGPREIDAARMRHRRTRPGRVRPAAP
jgi:Fe2+ transport system protein FeoA